jgi:hypothetical protein
MRSISIVTLSSFPHLRDLLGKVSIDVATVQTPDELHLVAFDGNADSVVAHPDAIDTR